MSILLVCVMLFSFTPLALADVSADAQALAEKISQGITFVDYYKEKKLEYSGDMSKESNTFAKLPELSEESGFVYDNNTLKYKDESGDLHDVRLEISVNNKTVNASSGAVLLEQNRNEGLIPIIQTVDYTSEEGINTYAGKQLDVKVTVYDDVTGNTSIATGSANKEKIADGDIRSENVTSNSSWLQDLKEFLFAPVTLGLRLLEELLTSLLLSLGDGILVQVSNAIGQPVDIESVIYGDVAKVSIDFWGGGGEVAASMTGVVETWYGAFRTIAIGVYIMILLVIGIKITFSSTGSGRAKYQMLLKDWVIGVALLFLFPYVMKIAVDLNTSLVRQIGGASGAIGAQTEETTQALNDLNSMGVANWFGGDAIVEVLQTAKGKTFPPTAADGMMYIRYLAGQQKRIPLTIVYLIMLFQTCVIIFVYYKRAFMTAFLITIFPLVAISYTVDKLGGGVTRTHAFGNWVKEFMLNVFMQSFHAATYVVIVNVGISAFQGSGNWFFLVICTTFLFQGERILRKIFNLGSGFGTMRDLGETGLAAWGVARAFANRSSRKTPEERATESDDDDSDSDDASDMPEVPHVPNIQATPGAQSNLQAINAGGKPSVNPQMAKLSGAQAVTSSIASGVRESRGRRMLTSAAGALGGAMGATLGATYKLASGAKIDDVAVAATGGWAVGKSAGKFFVAKPINGISNAFAGRRYKKAVLNGEYDKELQDAGIDLSSMEAKTADLIRQALAEQTSAAIRRGEKVGEYKFQKSINKNK